MSAITVYLTPENTFERVDAVAHHAHYSSGCEIVMVGPIGSGVVRALEHAFPNSRRILGALLEPTDLGTVTHMTDNAEKGEGTALIVDGVCEIEAINDVLFRFSKMGGNLIRIHNAASQQKKHQVD